MSREKSRISLSHRVVLPELMDSPELAVAPHRSALRGLRRVNLLSQSAAAILMAIRSLPLRVGSSRPLRVLDVGCGSGDVTTAVCRRLNARGIAAELIGWDRSSTAVAEAVQRAGRTQSVRFEVRDIFGEISGSFDVVYCSLFLHHFRDDQACQLLQRMQMLATQVVIVDDLVRSRRGLLLAAAGCRLLSRSPIVHADGPQSVRAAFTLAEIRSVAKKAGMETCRLRTHWPQRFSLTWCRE